MTTETVDIKCSDITPESIAAAVSIFNPESPLSIWVSDNRGDIRIRGETPPVQKNPSRADTEEFEVVRRRYVFKNPNGAMYEVVIFNCTEGRVFARIAGGARLSLVGWFSSDHHTALEMFQATFPKDTFVGRV